MLFLFILQILNEESESDSVTTINYGENFWVEILGTVGGMLAIALVGGIVFCAMVKKRYGDHGTYSPQKHELNNPKFEMKERMFEIPPEERLI